VLSLQLDKCENDGERLGDGERYKTAELPHHSWCLQPFCAEIFKDNFSQLRGSGNLPQSFAIWGAWRGSRWDPEKIIDRFQRHAPVKESRASLTKGQKFLIFPPKKNRTKKSPIMKMFFRKISIFEEAEKKSFLCHWIEGEGCENRRTIERRPHSDDNNKPVSARLRAIFNLDKTILATEETNLARRALAFSPWSRAKLFAKTQSSSSTLKSFLIRKTLKSRMEILIFLLVVAPFMHEKYESCRSFGLNETFIIPPDDVERPEGGAEVFRLLHRRLWERGECETSHLRARGREREFNKNFISRQNNWEFGIEMSEEKLRNQKKEIRRKLSWAASAWTISFRPQVSLAIRFMNEIKYLWHQLIPSSPTVHLTLFGDARRCQE
jgi:hypothetical protein